MMMIVYLLITISLLFVANLLQWLAYRRLRTGLRYWHGLWQEAANMLARTEGEFAKQRDNMSFWQENEARWRKSPLAKRYRRTLSVILRVRGECVELLHNASAVGCEWPRFHDHEDDEDFDDDDDLYVGVKVAGNHE